MLGKEYSKADSRYVGRDPTVVIIEGITAVLAGPGCLLAVYVFISFWSNLKHVSLESSGYLIFSKFKQVCDIEGHDHERMMALETDLEAIPWKIGICTSTGLQVYRKDIGDQALNQMLFHYPPIHVDVLHDKL